MRTIATTLALAAILVPASKVVAADDPAALPAAVTAPPCFDPSFDGNGVIIETTPVPSRFWGSAEYLMWWPKSGPAPTTLFGAAPVPAPVMSTGPLPTAPGFIGLMSTGSVPGGFNEYGAGIAAGNSINGLQSGARFTLGYWLDAEQRVGLEGGYFFLGLGQNWNAASGGSPSLVMPYFDAATGVPTNYTIAQPATTTTLHEYVNTTPGVFVHLYDTTATNAYSGSVHENAGGDFQAFDANAFFKVIDTGLWRLNLLVGFRYAELNEDLGLVTSVTHTQSMTVTYEPALGLGVPGYTNSSVVLSNRADQFNTRNSFYGGQVGAENEFRFGPVSVFAGGQIAFGTVSQVVDINGFSNFTTASTITPVTGITLAGIPLAVPTGAPAVTTKTAVQSIGGLFAQPGNLGNYNRTTFAVMPQGDFKIAYHITDRVMATVGYTFVYLSSVARAGDQIDHTINTSLLASTGSASAATKSSFGMQTTDFWAQGLTYGVTVKY